MRKINNAWKFLFPNLPSNQEWKSICPWVESETKFGTTSPSLRTCPVIFALNILTCWWHNKFLNWYGNIQDKYEVGYLRWSWLSFDVKLRITWKNEWKIKIINLCIIWCDVKYLNCYYLYSVACFFPGFSVVELIRMIWTILNSDLGIPQVFIGNDFVRVYSSAYCI